MAIQYYTPEEGSGATQTDPVTGVTYIFNANDSSWTPISTGEDQPQEVMPPIYPDSPYPDGISETTTEPVGDDVSAPITQPVDDGPSAADLFAAQVKLAQSAAEAGRVQAQQGWDKAKGIFDEGIGTLGTRREEFKDIYDTGSNEILGRYEGERGNLQAGNQGQETNMRNSLRALGMGGSAFVKGQGRLNQQKIGAAGDLASERSTNDLANLTGYNTNNEWATGQETGLNRFLQGASDQLTNANNQIGLAQQGDVNQINQNVSTLMQNMQAHQQALQAAQGGIAGYETNPYAVNMSSMLGALNGGAASIGGNQTAGNQASNVTQNGYTLADLLKQQAGGNMYA